MANSIDDLERAVEELINTADLSARQHEVYAARARELVLRLRAGIAECERLMSFDNTGLYSAAQLLHEKLTGATVESEKGDE